MAKHRKALELTTTAYGEPWDSMEGGGTTSTGLRLGNGKQALVVAVDPTQIPYGTKLKIPGNPFGNDNLIFTAGDTGGAFGSGTKKLDFYIADRKGAGNHDRLNAWGVKKLKAYVVGHGSPTDVGYLDHPSAFTGSRKGQKFGSPTIAHSGNAPAGSASQTGTKTVSTQVANPSAMGLNMLANMLSKHQNPNSLLIQTLEQKAADPITETKTVPTGTSKPGTATSAALSQMKSSTSKGLGKIAVAAGANRAGVTLQKPVIKFLEEVAGQGIHINVTTGTNHNQYVAGENGVQSDHWTGNAADLGMGGDARSSTAVERHGDRVAAAAIAQASGMSFEKAYKIAKAGGVHNFMTKVDGRSVRVQVLWKTMVGGNHYNHVHVGVAPR